MSVMPDDEGLSVVDEPSSTRPDDDPPDDGPLSPYLGGDGDLDALRDEFVGAFNARDLDTLLGLVVDDVETPDLPGDGAAVFAEELEAIWERSPGAVLTRAFLDDVPCAVAWLPDEEGCWARAALVCFASEDGLLSVVGLPDDADALDRAEAVDPTDEELEEWSDWAGWDRGEETQPRARDRTRP